MNLKFIYEFLMNFSLMFNPGSINMPLGTFPVKT